MESSEWRCKLGYELYNEENKLSLTNNSVITELTATGSDKKENI